MCLREKQITPYFKASSRNALKYKFTSTNTNICHTYYSSPALFSIESPLVMTKSVLAFKKPDKILLSHFYSNMKTATRLINILNLVLVILILISIFGTYQQIKQTNENMKYMNCDSYAYNQDQAPSYCK